MGRSSLEVLIELSAFDSAAAWWQYMGAARFTMVLREPDMSKGCRVTGLQPATDNEKRLFEAGRVQVQQGSLRCGRVGFLPCCTASARDVQHQ